MAKPTEQAQKHFDYAFRAAKQATLFLEKPKMTDADKQLGDYNHATAVAHLAKGLSELAVGLRATYLLLEEVRTRLKP